MPTKFNRKERKMNFVFEIQKYLISFDKTQLINGICL